MAMRGLLGRGRRVLRARPGLVALGLLLVVGGSLRIVLSLADRPATLSQFDANPPSYGRPREDCSRARSRHPVTPCSCAGRTCSATRSRSRSRSSTRLRSATALLAWSMVRRFSVSDWLGLVPAAVVLPNSVLAADSSTH